MKKQLGAIFDVDGVLIDSGPAHFEAFREMGKRLNAPFSEEFFTNCFGFHNNQIFPLWLGPLADSRVAELANEKEAIYRELAPRWVKPVEGAVELVRELKACGWKLAIGSSGPKQNVELAISILGIGPMLECAITGDDVKEGKPHPEIFLLGAQGMNLQPCDCVVFEDALAGIEAASRALMKCVAITTSLPKARVSHANQVIDYFREINSSKLEKLLTGE